MNILLEAVTLKILFRMGTKLTLTVSGYAFRYKRKSAKSYDIIQSCRKSCSFSEKSQKNKLGPTLHVSFSTKIDVVTPNFIWIRRTLVVM